MFPALNVTSMGGGRYAVDDRAVDYAFLRSFMADDEDAPPLPEGASSGGTGGGGSPSGYPAISSGTNLWIEILQVTNSQAFLRLHNTVSNELYQLQSRTNIVPGEMFWIPGEIITATGTNVDFSPVDATPRNQFFRGQHGTEVVFLSPSGNAIRPDLPRDGGATGTFTASRSDTNGDASSLTIFYRTSGSAVPGVDYEALPGSATFDSTFSETIISVVPFQTNTVQFEEQVILTLIPTNTYLINTNGSSATIGLEDNFTNSPLQLVSTSLTNPAGMAYHPLSNCLIISFNSISGDPPNDFVRMDTNGSNATWTGITGLQDEVKLAIAQTNAGGFNIGDMYFGTGTNSILAKLSANGTTSNLDWLTLTNEGFPVRLSLHFDDSGAFSNDLIAVTGDFNGLSGGDVFRITSGTNATLLTNIGGLHLEGVTTLPNDTIKYGPWAGKILTGAVQDDNLFTVDTNTNVVAFSMGIASEDIHIIPTNQDFYMADRINSLILKLPRSLFTNFVGDVMITQEGELPSVFIVHWDTNSSTFLQRRIPAPTGFPGVSGGDFNFEHGTFAPMNIPATPISN
jgi:hypothetical protein